MKQQHKQRLSGLPVVDASRAINLIITKGDIHEAKLKDPTGCVAAKACKKHLHVRDVRIHLTRAFLMFREGVWTKFSTPKSLRTEIVAFDRGGKFMPGTHILGVPPASKPRGNRPSKQTPGNHKATKRHKTLNVRASA